jgi:hypothetical protein
MLISILYGVIPYLYLLLKGHIIYIIELVITSKFLHLILFLFNANMIELSEA